MDIGTAVNRIAERTYESRRLWGQSLRQRRTEFTDVYGIPYTSEIESNKQFIYRIMISPDLEYYERFQFKLHVEAEGSINPDKFTLEMTDTETYDDNDYEWVDLTDYLEEQQNEWVDGSGYFPTEAIGETGDDDFYDILDACGMIALEDKGKDEDRKSMLLNAGSKLIRIKSPVKCDVTMNLFLKYSTINR